MQNTKQFELLSEKYKLDLNKNEHNYLNHKTQLAYDFYCSGLEANFMMAHEIANAACHMDDMRAQSVYGQLTLEMRTKTVDHVKKLHDIAEKLAGKNISKIYAESDE